MSESTCTQCQQPVPADAPGGSCPTCLLRLGFGSGSAEVGDQPTLDEVRPNTPGPHATLPRAVSTNVDTGFEIGRSRREQVVLANYDLIEELGSGGMGIVYKAWQKRAERFVAVKIIKGGADIDPDTRERFAIEAKTLARLKHPNIVQIFEVDEEEGRPYFSMEYIEGGSLARLIKKTPPTWHESARMIETLARTMQAAHDAGVLHRDLKPGNVLLTKDGTPKISDFGLAKHLEKDEGQTPLGMRLGTPSYMAPEQATGDSRKVTTAADVYALGATLYEMLAGVPPFRAETSVETAVQVLTKEPAPPSSHREGVPAELEAICLKCLEKDPANRYLHASNLADDLARWQRGESTRARPLRWPTRLWRGMRKRAGVLAAALVLAVSTTITIAVVASRPEPVELPPPPPPVNGKKPPAPEPRAALIEMQKRLREGKPVTLIGEKGPPVWFEWERGVGTVVPSPQNDGVFTYESLLPCYLTLLINPDAKAYRLKAEIRLERQDRMIDADIGTYCCFEAYPLPPPHYAASGLGVFFSETEVPAMAELQQFNVLHRPNQEAFRSATTTAQVSFASQYVGPRPWRGIVIDVSPEKVDAVWKSTKGPDRSFKALTRNQMLENVKNAQRKMTPARFDLKLELQPPNPHGAIGIYLSRGAISLRNVVVEPLIP